MPPPPGPLPPATRDGQTLALASDHQTTSIAPAARLWPLVAAGLFLEVLWLATAALTYPLTNSLAYTRNWVLWLGVLWNGLEWLLLRLDAVAPGIYSGDPPHRPAFVLFLGALLLGYAAYLFAIKSLDGRLNAHPAAPWVVVTFAVLFQATLWCMPGILTTDIASYAVYGRIAGVYGANPYVVPPSAFPTDPFVPWWIPRMWMDTTPPYGPLWMDLSWAIARATGGMDQIAQIVSYRLLVNVAHLANMALVWWLLERLSVTARLATFAAFAWSPLLLFQVTANGHNDAVMILLVLLAVAAFVGGTTHAGVAAGRSPALAPLERTRTWLAPVERNRIWLAPLALLCLATLVKWTPALVALFFVAASLRCLADWRSRLVWLSRAGALLIGLTLLIAWPWLGGLVTSGAVFSRVGVGYANWLVDVPAAWFAAHVLDRGGVDTEGARATARALFASPAVVAFVVLVASELRRVWRVANAVAAPRETTLVMLGASTRTLLVAVVLVSTQLQSWYFSWPLTLGLLLGWRTTTARVALAYSLLFPPVSYLREQAGWPPVDPLLIAYAALPMALPVIAWARRRPSRPAAIRTALGLARRRA